jgi:hypothetical protein
MAEGTPQRRTAFFRAVARSLEDIADTDLDPRRRAQLQSVADGFERYADRIEQAFTELPVN